MTFQSARAVSLDVALATVILQRRFVSVGTGGLAVQTGAAADALGVALEASTSSEDKAVPVADVMAQLEASIAAAKEAKVAA